MKRIAWLGWPAAAALLVLWAQEPQEAPPARLPNGKPQMDEILKDDHQKSLGDVSQIIKLAEEIKADMEKNDSHVLSIAALKRTEESKNGALNIRGRIRRY